MRTHDTLNGGAPLRLAKYRRNLARSIETIRKHRTPEDAAEFIQVAGYTSALNHRYDWLGDIGANIGEQLRRARDERRNYIAAPWSLVDGWRDAGDVADILPRSLAYAGTFYCDGRGGEYRGHVWQLPARDGVAQYVAGYIEAESRDGNGRQSGYVVLSTCGGTLETFAEKEDAAKDASDLAERMAREEYEYDQRWQEASDADADRNAAREELKGSHARARKCIAAIRELPKGNEFKHSRDMLINVALPSWRDAMHAAIARIAECTDTIESLDMTGEF
jgi:hypothetical protein